MGEGFHNIHITSLNKYSFDFKYLAFKQEENVKSWLRDSTIFTLLGPHKNDFTVQYTVTLHYLELGGTV